MHITFMKGSIFQEFVIVQVCHFHILVQNYWPNTSRSTRPVAMRLSICMYAQKEMHIYMCMFLL